MHARMILFYAARPNLIQPPCFDSVRRSGELISALGPRSSVGHAGIENSSENQRVSSGSGHTVDTDRRNAASDPRLLVIVNAWPDLPKTAKARILAIVQSASEQRTRKA